MSISLIAQNVGIGEPNPRSKLSVKGSLSVGENYTSFGASSNGLIVEGIVGLGTSDPHMEAILDISGANKTIILPRMTTAQRTAVAEVKSGMMI